MHAILNFLGRFQRMHLFTRVLVGFVFALIAWANTIPYYQDPAIVFAGYGWPFKCLELPTIVFHFLDGRRHPERSHYFYAPEFVVNLLVAFVIPALLAVLLERLVWKNSSRFRLHLSTCLIMLCVCAALLGANLYAQDPGKPAFMGSVEIRGWPFVCHETILLPAKNASVTEWHLDNLLFNAITAVLALGATVYICEYRHLRYAAKQPPVP